VADRVVWKNPGKHRATRQRYNRAHYEAKGEQEPDLTGYIQGKDATEGEERAARALSDRADVLSYSFREVPVGAEMMPGSVELDFYIQTDHGDYMLQIDEDKWHDPDKDATNDAILNQAFAGSGRTRPVKRFPAKDFETQKKASRTMEEVLL